MRSFVFSISLTADVQCAFSGKYLEVQQSPLPSSTFVTIGGGGEVMSCVLCLAIGLILLALNVNQTSTAHTLYTNQYLGNIKRILYSLI